MRPNGNISVPKSSLPQILENFFIYVPAFSGDRAAVFSVTIEICFQQVSIYIEHGLNKCCIAFRAGMFKIILSNFSMWHFNSGLIIFGKQKQISMGVECYMLEEFGRVFFIFTEHVAQNHSKALQKYKDNFSSELLEEHLVHYEMSSAVISYQFFLIIDVVFHLSWVFYLISYLFFTWGCRWKNYAKRLFLIVYPNSVWGRKQEYLKSLRLWAWLNEYCHSNCSKGLF